MFELTIFTIDTEKETFLEAAEAYQHIKISILNYFRIKDFQKCRMALYR